MITLHGKPLTDVHEQVRHDIKELTGKGIYPPLHYAKEEGHLRLLRQFDLALAMLRRFDTLQEEFKSQQK